jgi:serine/threonine-protein kinase
VQTARASNVSERASSSARYEPIAQIGRGGMAEVLLAMMDAGGGVRRLAVLKRMGPELASDPDFVEMFLDEARLSLRLSHANVVRTYEALVGDDELAIAMEYLDGQPLTRVLNRLLRGKSELALPLRLRILTSVLAGLEHAHTLTDLDGTPLGVVHRDVSPQNVFVTYDGQIKLVDFGVAKTAAASHQTRPGAIKGKLAYMAPEQLQCDAVDRRADIFSVGVMMWEMLAQRRLWQGKTEVEIVGHLASGRLMPPLPLLDDLPDELDAICMRALEPDPEHRYQTAAEMEADLERVLVGAADSHARNLGKVVAHAFAAERAERQAIIERCLHRDVDAPPEAEAIPIARPPASSGSLPTIDIVVADLDEDKTPVLPPRVSSVTSAVVAAPAELLVPPAHAPDPQRALRRWRAAAVAGMVATAAMLVVAVGLRRGPADRAAPYRAATAVSLPVAPAPAATPAASDKGASARPQTSRAAHDESDRPRRHRRQKVVDEDATLPPTGTEDES